MVIDSVQKPNSPKALLLGTATHHHGMLTTESEMPPHFEDVKDMQIKSKVTICMDTNNVASYPSSAVNNNTPYQGQGKSIPQFVENSNEA